MKSMDLWMLVVIPSILLLCLIHILPNPKDTHKEVSGSHSGVMNYPLDNPNKVSPKTSTNAIFICLKFYSSDHL
jgi:hypothetical protein